jgi:putative flavoprotein involved in K+ transport
VVPGFRADWSWIDVPFLDATGYPDHHRGVVRPTSGLYVLGLPWLHTWGSGRFASGVAPGGGDGGADPGLRPRGTYG